MRSRNDGIPIGLVIIFAAAAFITYEVWQFSEALHVSFDAGSAIFGWTVAAAVFLLVIYFSAGFGVIPLELTWPIALGMIFRGFWPAIKEWGEKIPVLHGSEFAGLAWWAEWYTLWPILIALVVGGYGFSSSFDRRY
ncbi:hypothetical protein ACVBEG_16525 [Pseudomonas sp. GG8]